MPEAFLRPAFASWSPRDTVLNVVYLIAVISYLLLGLSRRSCRVIIAAMRCLVKVSLLFYDHRLLDSIAKDPRTILHHFNLDPDLTPYTCCPKCFALYDSSCPPERCTSQDTPRAAVCDAKLWRVRRIR
ncbi:hypothetical protein OBBRIDRAFT_740846, partial [Obba rivulosa]